MLLKFDSHSLGSVFETPNFTAFFGHRGADREALTKAFPDYTLSYLKQTHSDIVVDAKVVARSGDPVEADAQITNENRIALCIRTADCVPVLISDRDSKYIAAIHAGWRGVANGIIVKTGKALHEKGTRLSSARAFIGPHIGAQSFEVGDDVAELLVHAFEAVRGYSSEQTPIAQIPEKDLKKEGKKHIDLLRIVRAQLASIGIEKERILELPIDTVTSEAHESFRRDRERGGRQTSFIAFKNP